jgi:ketosteroid isomerase-like protein
MEVERLPEHGVWGDTALTMSQENVEQVRSWVAAINRADFEAMAEIAAPDVTYRSYLAAVMGGESSYRGHEGLRQYLRDLDEAWDWFHVDFDELRDLGDHILMLGRLRARGKASGLEVEEQMAWIHTFREGTGTGRYTQLRFFATEVEALEAVGLSE